MCDGARSLACRGETSTRHRIKTDGERDDLVKLLWHDGRAGVFRLAHQVGACTAAPEPIHALTKADDWPLNNRTVAKTMLLTGSGRGDRQTAIKYFLIVAAQRIVIDPQPWRADILAGMPALTASRLPELLP